ncbi:hypothetical protein PSU4_32020 [Pseudonocardia sulfidoxydans NBRC 16205]|uniref:Uncharacterized protein n=1 Tax=Pseudonocardia sulfidoxydans NBRC 16205 TaxID=1223511 RepID=A0A511DMF4_9PSEU|nr:nickel-dependent lactate racemase [Pseudonocardia sulfidoxydans]GEL24248.1 hypothetical protein PSU4_32020 [Pseudonocardia sulfidoxydans NBRC 16205]
MTAVTRRVRIAYGEHGLDIDVPVDATVIEPLFERAADDQEAVLRDALRRPVAGPPLRERVRGRGSVAISMCDLTRPQPRQAMVQAILDEIEGLVPLRDVVVLVATGTHRGNTAEEIREMLGDEIPRQVRVVNHDARDRSTLLWCGVRGDGVPVWLNREWMDAGVRITTGFVEPHFFAGFSGGPKLAAPGLAALETVMVLHDARRIGHPDARWGVCEGNPVHDDIRAIAAETGVDFALDVILNRDKGIVAAYGGALAEMHAAARSHARRLSMREVDAPADVVVTTNSGYPLDQNLYQAVKGMSAAAQVVRPGGTIVCAAECRDGFPDHGEYREILQTAPSPQALLDSIRSRRDTVPDQWQVQIQARIQVQADVVVHASYLSDADLRQAHLQPTHDISEVVADRVARVGAGARVVVLPEGPQTIPYLAAR